MKFDLSILSGYQFLLTVTTILSFFVTFIAFRLFSLMRAKVPDSAKHWRFMILGSVAFSFYQLFYIFHWANLVNVNDFIVFVKLMKLCTISFIGISLYQFTHASS